MRAKNWWTSPPASHLKERLVLSAVGSLDVANDHFLQSHARIRQPLQPCDLGTTHFVTSGSYTL
eukprot:2612469-Pleurochrysis_carterae.AAC.1